MGNTGGKEGTMNLRGKGQMPKIGLGTYQLADDAHGTAIEAALDAGYKLLDGAYIYGNAALIGKILKKRNIKREDIFITDKLASHFMGSKELVRQGLELSLSRFQLDYVDLFLCHFPMGIKHVGDDDLFPADENGVTKYEHVDLVETWRGMELMVDAGKAKAIGLSNFTLEQLKKVVENARIPVANLQIEVHVYLQQKELRKYCKSHGITVTAYAPLGGCPQPANDGKPKVMEDPVVKEIAAAHNVTPAQVLLAFLLAENIAIVPKSATKERIKENFEAGSVNLTNQDMAKLRKLDNGTRYYDFKGWYEGHPDYPF